MNKREPWHHLAMQGLYLFGSLILTVAFGYCWYDYYAIRIIYPFFRRGNWVVIFLYWIILLASMYMNEGQKVGYFTFGQTIFSQLIGLFMADLIMYIVIALIARQMMNALPLLLLLVLQSAFLILWTYLSTKIYHHIVPPRRMVLVSGKGRHVDALIKKVSSRDDKYEISRQLDESLGLENILPNLSDFDAVMICDLNIHNRNIIMKYCYEHDIRIYVAPRISDTIIRSATEIHLFDTPLLLCRNYGLSIYQRAVKRFFDILISAIALILLSPLMLGIAAAIKIYDGGPVFYRQVRLTLNGKEFKILKFRSMIVNAEKAGAQLAGKYDPRITPVGHFIRRYRLDELPQLLNILKGDMSLVGPRPERPALAAKISETIPEFNYRLKVKAGLTGFAQVIGKYNTSPYDKLEMDLMYIADYSLMKDLRILLMTPKMLFVHDGSEGVVDENEYN